MSVRTHVNRRLSAVLAAVLVPSSALAAVVGLAAPAEAATTVTVVGPTVTVRPGLPVPTGSTSASVKAARNEFESVQLVIEPDAQISNLVLDVAAPLQTGTPEGPTLATSNVTFYREAYYEVLSTDTIDTRTDGESVAGQWPDALIPQKDYIYGEDRAAFHAAVPAGGRVVVWVDVLVPADQSAGVYSGAIRVKDGGTVLKTVPLSVQVHDFTLPSTSSLENLFLTSWNAACYAHTGHNQCGWDIDEAMRFQALYERVALENRVTLSNPWPVAKNQSLDDNSWGIGQAMHTAFRKYVVPVLNGTATDPSLGSALRLPGARATTLALHGRSRGAALADGCGTACVNSWKTEAATSGFADRLLYYACDEPYTNEAWWDECNETHTQVSGASGLRELVTAAIDTADVEGDDAHQWIDTMVPLIRQVAGKPGNRWSGNQRADYDTWLAGNDGDGGRELWLYHACESGGCNGRYSADQSTAWNAPYWNGWASYAVDAPASQSRAASWLAYEYGATGELYYDTTLRLAQAWDPCTSVTGGTMGNCLYAFGLNGDGTLFYPGKACPVANGAGCIGGTKDIPIESMRLKHIRDGREDYEYLALLDGTGDPTDAAFAQQTALGVFGPTLETATFSTTVSQQSVDDARAALASRILDVVDQGPALSVQDIAVAEGTGVGYTPLNIVVTRTGDLSAPSTVAYTLGGTAVGNETDYHDDTPGGLVTFDAGADQGYVYLDVVQDAVDESDETITVTLHDPVDATILDGSGVATIVDDDGPVTPPSTYLPDVAVKKAGGSYVGGNVRNRTGAGQTITVRSKRGLTKTFYLLVQNDGNVPDSYSLVGTRSQRGFTTRYFRGSSDVTATVGAGTASSGVLAPAGSTLYRLVVKAGTRVRSGTVRTWTFHAVSFNSEADPKTRDTVVVRVRVR
ncbi:MAG TPA: hypothetical protein VFK41_04825 [Nocardioidaceae bacterium]|nr:hypothetical protein [Nocardioidaceae bacterium]